ncbi:unnamed protein product [Orchesella dallaii]|uniref:Uncharacterized protein n=1 Tax=Orchesella dallaii TaxID=48710 RepID=A0ABP1QV79_9HEXA
MHRRVNRRPKLKLEDRPTSASNTNNKNNERHVIKMCISFMHNVYQEHTQHDASPEASKEKALTNRKPTCTTGAEVLCLKNRHSRDLHVPIDTYQN